MTTLKNTLKNAYLGWLEQKISVKDLENGVIEITTPLLDSNNDHLQIYVVPLQDDKFKLTDDGYIMSELRMIGFDLKSSNKRKEIFNTIINGFGISYHSKTEELFTTTTMKDFPQKKHMLLQAMLSVNDMFMTVRATAKSIFLEDVENFFYDNDIPYAENISLTGKSGYNHKFHFVLPRSRKKPERIIQTINNPNKNSSETILFAWNDTKETRKSDSELFVFLNDSGQKISTSIISAFSKYDVKPVPWSQRDKYIPQLTAS